MVDHEEKKVYVIVRGYGIAIKTPDELPGFLARLDELKVLYYQLRMRKSQWQWVGESQNDTTGNGN